MGNTNIAKKFSVNIGLNERCVRIILSILIFAFALKYSEWLLVFAVLFLVTGIVGWSPSYQLFRINTDKKNLEKKLPDKKNSPKPKKKK